MSNQKKLIDAFGVSFHTTECEDCSDAFRVVLGLDSSKDPANPSIVVVDKIDTTEEIQSFKDQCGLSYIQGLVSKGVDARQFMDDGKSGQDGTMSKEINEVSETLKTVKAQADKIAEQIDAKDYMKVEDVEKYVEEKIKAFIENQTAAAAKGDTNV